MKKSLLLEEEIVPSVKTIEKFGPREVIARNVKPEKRVGLKKVSLEEDIEKEWDNTANLAGKKKIGKIVLSVSLIIVTLLSGATAYYFYHKYQLLTTNETDRVVSKIGKILELPQDEKPTLATVTDKKKMKDQAFFAHAENGDRVLIYAKSQKAVLYRESANKIIEMMPLSMSNPSDTSAQQQSGAETPKTNEQVQQEVTPQEQPSVQEQAVAPEQVNLTVAIYNGSGIKGLAAKLGEKITVIKGMNIVEKTNATGSYEKNIVVDLSGNHVDAAQKIADSIGGEVGALPEGEVKPEADILVIGATE